MRDRIEDDAQPTDDELDAIGGALTAVPQPEAPEPAPWQEQVYGATGEVPPEAKDAYQLKTASPPQPVAAKATSPDYASILKRGALPDDLNDDALKAAQRNDKSNYWFGRASDAIAAATRRTPVQYSEGPPSEADALLKRRQAATAGDDKDRALRLQLLRLKQPGGSTKTPEELAELAARTKKQLAEADNYTADNERARTAAESAAAEHSTKLAHDASMESGELFEGDKAALQAIAKQKGIKVDFSGIKTRPMLDKMSMLLTGKPSAGRGGGAASQYGDLEESAKSVADGSRGIMSVPMKVREKVWARAKAINPKLDAAAFDIRKAGTAHTLNDSKVVAGSIAMHHVDLLDKMVDSDAGFDAPAMNKIKMALFTGAGEDDLTPQQLAWLASAHEVARAYGADSQAAQHAFEVIFSPTASKKQKKAVIGTARKYLGGALAGQEEQLQRYNPQGAGDFHVVKPGGDQHGGTTPPAEESKSIGGKVFHKVNGKWVTED